MDEDELRRLLSETTPRPSRRLDVAAVRRRGRLRRARVIGAGAAAILSVVALGAVVLPPSGETVVFSPNSAREETPETAEARMAEPEPTEPAEEDPSPMPEPETTPEPEPTHEPSPAPPTEPAPSPTPTPSVEPEVEPESDSEREARSYRNGAPLWGRDFVGVAVTENGQPKELVPGTEIRVSFFYRTDTDPHGGGIGWYGGCNHSGFRVHVEPDRLMLEGGGGSTLRGCPDAKGEQEAWLYRFLWSAPFWRVEGERLWLWSGDTIIEWVEDHRPPENQ